MKFFCKWGGIETHQPWNRPEDVQIRRWYDSLDTELQLYLVGNVVEKHSPTFDVDVMIYKHQPPLDVLSPPLDVLSETFSECIRKGFEHNLLIDIAFISEWYSIPFKPFYKIRPDKEFIKHWNGDVYHSVYEADKVEQIGEQLWRYDWQTPHENYYKGLNRGYTFKGIKIDKF